MSSWFRQVSYDCKGEWGRVETDKRKKVLMAKSDLKLPYISPDLINKAGFNGEAAIYVGHSDLWQPTLGSIADWLTALDAVPLDPWGHSSPRMLPAYVWAWGRCNAGPSSPTWGSSKGNLSLRTSHCLPETLSELHFTLDTSYSILFPSFLSQGSDLHCVWQFSLLISALSPFIFHRSFLPMNPLHITSCLSNFFKSWTNKDGFSILLVKSALTTILSRIWVQMFYKESRSNRDLNKTEVYFSLS